MSGSLQIQNLSNVLKKAVAQTVDIRELVPDTIVNPGETVLTKAQLQALNKNVDLPDVPRKEGSRGPASQFEGWSGAKGGFHVSSEAYPEGTKGWRFTTQMPISMGGKLVIPLGSTVSSGPTAVWPLNLTIPGSGGKSGPSLIQFQADTIHEIVDQIESDTGISSTKTIIKNGDGDRAVQVELWGKIFFDQKNGELKIVRAGEKGEYLVQTLQNALKEHYKKTPSEGPYFADALRKAGVSR